MSSKKVSRKEIRRAKAEARRLLRSPNFFNMFLETVKRAGLVGEEKNALVVLIVAVSRLLEWPLNLFIKASSAAGKNFLAKIVLGLMPMSTKKELSSFSDKALDYSGDDFRHRVMFVQELNKKAGNVHPIRLLISEKKITRKVTERSGRGWVTTEYVTRGPVASISTSTRPLLEIDDETRHLSITLDESEEQSERITRAYGTTGTGLSSHERRVWRMVHRLLEQRLTDIRLPRWWDAVAKGVFKKDLRVRRYYPNFVEAARTVGLIRSFQTDTDPAAAVILTFEDYAIAALIFDEVFVDSLHRRDGAVFETRQIVDRLSRQEKKRAVRARDLAAEMHISRDRAYGLLRDAMEAGTIQRANEPERSNVKLYMPKPRPRFVPDPEELFQQLTQLPEKVQFPHPITGERIVYTRRGKRPKK